MVEPYGPASVLHRLALAHRSRQWARKLAVQATRYYAQGVAAPAVVDELSELHRMTVELAGARWLS